MGLGTRIFLVNDDNSIKRLPLKKFERLRRDEDSLPEYADKRLRYILVVLDMKNRKPSGIHLMQYAYLSFDSEGRIDPVKRENEVRQAIDIVPPIAETKGRVLDARHMFAKKRYEDEFKWTPSPQMEKRIIEAIFGKE